MNFGLPADMVPVAATWLATYLVHSTLIFGAVWLLQCRAGARLRDLLWKASLVLPLVTTTARMIAPTGGAAPTWTLPRLELGIVEVADALAAPAASTALPDWTVAPDARVEATLPSLAPTAPVNTPSVRNLALAWGGALVLLLGMARLFVPLMRIRGRLRSRRAIDNGPIRDEVDRLTSSARLVRAVSVYALDGISSPIAAGTLRPAVYLPAKVAELPPPMLRSLLAHELAHHVRFDPLWNRIAHATVAVMYFQPLHRIARNRIASAAELLADDQALRWTQDTEGLAGCLAEVAGWLRPDRRQALGVPMVRAKGQGALRERIERAFERPRETSAALRWPLTLGLAATTITLMPSLARTPFAPLDSSVAGETANRNPYLEALAPTFVNLERLSDELDGLPARGLEASELAARWRALQRQAEALRASVDTPTHPE